MREPRPRTITSEIVHSRNTPAWVSAACALVVCLAAVWSFASEPSQKTLEDHEDRIRTLEQLTTRQLTSIDTRLENMEREMKRMRSE